MTDFWKDRYKDQWEASNEREKLVASMVKGYEIDFVGFGAGSTEYLSGSAESHGKEKGGADLRIKGTDVYLEVTGSFFPIARHKPLWVRPDKIKAAEAHTDQKIWIVHCVESNNLFRVIPMNPDFLSVWHDFRIVKPSIRGAGETFVEIPADSEFVYEFDSFLRWLNNYAPRP